MDIELLEFVDNRGRTLAVDAAAGTVKNVKLLGPQSANGRAYSEQAMKQAVALYENAKVYLNHSTNPKDPRKVEDRFGEMRGVSYKPGEGIFAETFAYNPKHPFAEAFAWNAEHSPHSLGFSHNIVGKTITKDGRTVIESISKVTSVDLVAEPATTRGLHESVDPSGVKTVDTAALTLEHIQARPDLVKAIIAEQQNGEQAKARDAEFKRLQEEVDGFKSAAKLAAKKAAVAQAIAEAKLPKELVSPEFVGFCEAADDAGLKLLIADRQALAKAIPAGRAPQSREQSATEGTLPTDNKTLVESWRN